MGPIRPQLLCRRQRRAYSQFSFEGRYQQDGPNVSITIVNHGLLPDKRVAIDFTSGDLLDGQYVINSVPDENTIVIVYPFSGTTQGDCTVSNLKIHELSLIHI